MLPPSLPALGRAYWSTSYSVGLHFLDISYKWDQALCVWFLSLSMMFSVFICAVTTCVITFKHSSFLKNRLRFLEEFQVHSRTEWKAQNDCVSTSAPARLGFLSCTPTLEQPPILTVNPPWHTAPSAPRGVMQECTTAVVSPCLSNLSMVLSLLSCCTKCLYHRIFPQALSEFQFLCNLVNAGHGQFLILGILNCATRYGSKFIVLHIDIQPLWHFLLKGYSFFIGLLWHCVKNNSFHLYLCVDLLLSLWDKV